MVDIHVYEQKRYTNMHILQTYKAQHDLIMIVHRYIFHAHQSSNTKDSSPACISNSDFSFIYGNNNIMYS